MMTDLMLARHQIVVESAQKVHARLGKRRPLQDYEAALVEELRMHGIGIRENKNTQILFGGTSVGVYLADIIIDGEILIELKRAERLTDAEKSSFAGFVNDFEYQRGYLMNFAADDLEVASFPPSPR